MSDKRTRQNREKQKGDTGPLLHELHPASRKASRQRRDARTSKRKSEARDRRYREVLPQVTLALWFRDHMDEGRTSLTESEVVDLVEQYLDECQEFARDRPGTNGAMMAMRARKDREQFDQFGLSVPDLTTKENVAALKSWDGDAMLLTQGRLTFRSFCRTQKK